MSAPTAPAQRYGVKVQTTDATVTTVATLATQTDKSYIVTATVVCKQPSGSKSAGYIRAGTFINNAGSLSQVGATTAIATHETDAAWDCELFVTGTTIGCRVTGAAAVTIDWLANLLVQQVPN